MVNFITSLFFCQHKNEYAPHLLITEVIEAKNTDEAFNLFISRHDKLPIGDVQISKVIMHGVRGIRTYDPAIDDKCETYQILE